MSEPRDFVTSLDTFLVAGAREIGFVGPLWIPRHREEMLAIFRGTPFDLLVYCAAGHGVNMTVTVAPESNANRGWNSNDEVGLGWPAQALTLPPWRSPRYGSSSELDTHIQELARRLPEFVAAARARGTALWSDVRECVRIGRRQNP